MNMEQAYAALRERLIDAHDRLLREREELAEQSEAQARLEGELNELRHAVAWREQEVKQLQTELEQMRATKLWQLGDLYWRAHARVKGGSKR